MEAGTSCLHIMHSSSPGFSFPASAFDISAALPWPQTLAVHTVAPDICLAVVETVFELLARHGGDPTRKGYPWHDGAPQSAQLVPFTYQS